MPGKSRIATKEGSMKPKGIFLFLFFWAFADFIRESIGAAHPVAVGGGSRWTGRWEKVVDDAVAHI
jgi:hypothetical protein